MSTKPPFAAVLAATNRIILGKDTEVRLALSCLLARGHLLIEDLPGVGKTTLAHALAQLMGLQFSRIQFTSDLLPADIVGTSIYDRERSNFRFIPGPVFAQLVLADEINRATPKTQSALLEAMEERQVTVDGITYSMANPFLVLATQNPVEYEGSFPLPEAQLDRFLVRLALGYPTRDAEMAIMDAQRVSHPVEALEQVVSAEDLLQAQTLIKDVHVSDLIKEYIVGLVGASRQHPDAYLGASPRGSLALYKTSQARAALQSRDYVIPDDVKALAEATLAHRIIVSPSARIKSVDARTIVEDLLRTVPVPGARAKPEPARA